MAYPGRPSIVPGIPMPQAIGITPYMPAMIPSVMAMPPQMLPVRQYRPQGGNKYLTMTPKKAAPEAGPPVTVFIGNIAEHAPDLMMKHILASCGQVLSWKRTQGFGFAEFGSPESALRAIRILHEMGIGPKNLVVKVDAKTTVKLNEYKKEERRKQGKPEPRPNHDSDLEDYVDDRMRHSDRQTQEKINQIILEFDEEMKNALLEKEEENKLKKEIIQNLPDKNRAQKSQEILSKLTRDAEHSNIKQEFEEGKRDIITREIGKFREIMKKQEAEREEERLRREEAKEEKEKIKLERNDRGRSHSRSRSVSTVHSVRSTRSHSKPPSPEPRHRNKNRRRSHSSKKHRKVTISPTSQNNGTDPRSRDRERERDRDRDREREKEREPKQTKKEFDRAVAREREEEEEIKERKKMEKKAKEKEIAYQERVRVWENRERKKRKEFEREKDKKRIRQEDTEREAKRLKEFLEDYDDERDDIKFYKGRELQKRIAERERERESDDKDRAREKEEIEELRNKILESEHSDPTAVYEQLLQEHEEMYKPKIIIDVNAEQLVRQREKEREREERERARLREREKEEIRALEEERRRKEEELAAMKAQEELDGASPSDDDDDRGADLAPPSNHNSPSDQGDDERRSISPIAMAGKKKKLDVKDVFNADEDEDSSHAFKKRKLVPLDYGEEKSSSKDRDHKRKDHQKKDDKKEKGGTDENSKSTEEKRKNIKSLIDKIPTDKSALFQFTIDWTAVDTQLMERRIRPWINKKIIEYIGEPEPTLVDFICTKVLAGSEPQGILDDVQMVLDEEAEVFVVKMWRLLIYEIEAKKLGLVK